MTANYIQVGWKLTIPVGKSTVGYFKKCASKYTSFVDALKSIRAQSSFAYRKKIAKKNGITSYNGSSKQNTTLLNKLKNGKLLVP